MSNEYVALAAFATVMFIVFVGGLLWQKYRHFIVKRLNLKHYRHDDGRETSHPVTQHH